MTFLDTFETLARIGKALPSGHGLMGLASKLAVGDETAAGGVAGKVAGRAAGSVAGRAGRLFSPAGPNSGWPGEAGLLGDPDEAGGEENPVFLLWLGRRLHAGASQRQLLLYPPPGRYRAEYWSPGDGRLAGVEIGTSSPLVLGPPGEGPFIVLFRRLA